MEYRKQSIAFFVCSNGYGHFKRVIEVVSHLYTEFTIDIFCEKYQYDKFKPTLPVNYVFYKQPNIRWDIAVKQKAPDFNSYKKWVDYYGKTIQAYDHVVSDNIVGLLEYRQDLILMGSFLWKDVFENKFNHNLLSHYDKTLLEKYNPVIITNKYAETDSVKSYKNKVQFGFGCKNKSRIKYWDNIKNIVIVPPSLNYLSSYDNTIHKLKQTLGQHWNVTSDLSITEECVYIVRPGVGMLTHCVENNIPIIALFDPFDSSEIITLAEQVQILKIGCAHNTKNIKELLDGYFIGYKLKKFFSNNIYNKIDLEKEGYKKTALHLKKLML